MRKEVKTSLLLWPAVASVAITTMSAVTMIEETKLSRIQASSVSLINRSRVSLTLQESVLFQYMEVGIALPGINKKRH